MIPWISSDKKRQRKQIEHAMFQVKYARRMKEDLLEPEMVDRLRKLQRDLKDHLKSGRLEEGAALADNAVELARDVHPAPRNAYGLRENLEVFVVVIAVALAFRTYFFQPYQIPTGSMQPTLYGITSVAEYEPNWTDKPPVRWGKFLLTGARYKEIRAKASGIMPNPEGTWNKSDTFYHIPVGGHTYKIHEDMVFRRGHAPGDRNPVIFQPGFPKPGEAVRKGEVIAKGLLKQGDHIIVNRFITNFARPKRGDIVVFSTDGLPYVRENSAYIKRLTGLPGEDISICEGKLVVDGKVVASPEVFERQYENEKYPGYSQLGAKWFFDRGASPRFTNCAFTQTLGENEFLMMGDNTNNSLDGRYFGPVPGENILGIGFFVPWPFFDRGIYNDAAGPVK